MLKKIIALVLLCLAPICFAAVNINTASVEQLESLPNIGPAKAKAIVDYRKTHGDFKTLEGLKSVKGIGDKVFNKIKPEIALSGETTVPARAPKAEKKVGRKAEMAEKPAAEESAKQTRKEKAAAKKAAKPAESMESAAK